MADKEAIREFFTQEQEAEIVAAIQAAERNTSGEIRVHVEAHCKGDAFKRGLQVFKQLHMHETQLRNGVLFYLATKDHKFAIIGDEGINAKVPTGFWNEIRDTMQSAFKKGQFTAGLCAGIAASGNALKAYFPYNEEDDVNELPDSIST